MNNLLSKIKESIKRHTIFQDAVGALLLKSGFAGKFDAILISRYKTYSQLNKKYAKYIGKNNFAPSPCPAKSKTIWVCWFQGMDTAPWLVKTCHETVKYYCSDWEIIVIDKSNLQEYTDLPDYIIEKWQKGIISNAHFSDIVRLNLLVRYGGLWLDSTVYLTGKIPSYITDGDLFVYRNGFFEEDMINMGNWLMYSKQNNHMLNEVLNLLYKYWYNCNYTKQYFIMHIFFKMVSNKYPDEWKKVPYYNHIDQHILAYEIGEKYNKTRFNQIMNLTSIHKLSNKLDLNSFHKESIYSKLDKLYKNQD